MRRPLPLDFRPITPEDAQKQLLDHHVAEFSELLEKADEIQEVKISLFAPHTRNVIPLF